MENVKYKLTERIIIAYQVKLKSCIFKLVITPKCIPKFESLKLGDIWILISNVIMVLKLSEWLFDISNNFLFENSQLVSYCHQMFYLLINSWHWKFYKKNLMVYVMNPFWYQEWQQDYFILNKTLKTNGTRFVFLLHIARKITGLSCNNILPTNHKWFIGISTGCCHFVWTWAL